MIKAEISEKELPYTNNLGRRVLLTATIGAEKFYRIWVENSLTTLDEKKAELRRQIRLYSEEQQ